MYACMYVTAKVAVADVVVLVVIGAKRSVMKEIALWGQGIHKYLLAPLERVLA